MGFYTTDTDEVRQENTLLARRCHLVKSAPPSKNRVWNFFTTSETCAGFFESQPVESHQEKWPTPTPTVSGVHFYGYRYYLPETGRWASRDPLGDRSFVLARRRAASFVIGDEVVRIIFEYETPNLVIFIDNSSINRIDGFGLEISDSGTGAEGDDKCDRCLGWARKACGAIRQWCRTGWGKGPPKIPTTPGGSAASACTRVVGTCVDAARTGPGLYKIVIIKEACDPCTLCLMQDPESDDCKNKCQHCEDVKANACGKEY